MVEYYGGTSTEARKEAAMTFRCSRFRLVLLATALIIATVGGNTRLPAQPPERVSVPPERLRKPDQPSPVEALEVLRQRYARVRSVYLRATAEVTTYGEPVDGIYPVLRVAAGSYEYWAQGDKYRLRSQVDKAAGLAMDTEVAWDGEFHQMLQIRPDVLSLRRGTPLGTFANLPNPFLAPVEFLTEQTDECRPLCTLRLSQLREERRWREARSAFERAQLRNHGVMAKIISPLLEDGTETTYLPLLRAGGTPRVDRMVVVHERLGRCETALEYSDEKTLEAQVVPHVVDVFCIHTSSDDTAEEVDDGFSAVRVVLEVHEVRLNEAFPPETFQIPREGREFVIDENASEREGLIRPVPFELDKP